MIKSAIDPLIEKVRKLELENEQLKARNCHLEAKTSLTDRRLDDMDQYIKRNNLILDGINIKRGETPESIRKIIWGEIDRLGLDIDYYEVDRAHRIESPYTDEWGYRRQPVIVRFLGWGARDLFYQARKDCRFRCRADLTPRRESILNNAQEKLDDPDKYWHVAQTIQYVFADRNCILQAHTTDGRLVAFSSDIEFEGVVNWVDSTSKFRNKVQPQFTVFVFFFFTGILAYSQKQIH